MSCKADSRICQNRASAGIAVMAWSRTTWLGGMRPQPFGDIPGPESNACGDPVMRDEVAGDVAIYRFRADRQQGRQFLCGQEIGTAIQVIEDVGRTRQPWPNVRSLSTVGAAPLNHLRASVACRPRTPTHGNGCTRGRPSCQSRKADYYRGVTDPGWCRQRWRARGTRSAFRASHSTLQDEYWDTEGSAGAPQTIQNSGGARGARDLTGFHV